MKFGHAMLQQCPLKHHYSSFLHKHNILLHCSEIFPNIPKCWQSIPHLPNTNHEWLEALHSVPMYTFHTTNLAMYTFHTTNLELGNHKGIKKEHDCVSIIRIIKCAAIWITMNDIFLTITELVESSLQFQLKNLKIPICRKGFHYEPYHKITLTQHSH